MLPTSWCPNTCSETWLGPWRRYWDFTDLNARFPCFSPRAAAAGLNLRAAQTVLVAFIPAAFQGFLHRSRLWPCGCCLAIAGEGLQDGGLAQAGWGHRHLTQVSRCSPRLFLGALWPHSRPAMQTRNSIWKQRQMLPKRIRSWEPASHAWEGESMRVEWPLCQKKGNLVELLPSPTFFFFCHCQDSFSDHSCPASTLSSAMPVETWRLFSRVLVLFLKNYGPSTIPIVPEASFRGFSANSFILVFPSLILYHGVTSKQWRDKVPWPWDKQTPMSFMSDTKEWMLYDCTYFIHTKQSNS